MTKTCLLLIDLQNDFLPGGALAVPGGDQVISVANEMIRDFDIVIASQDWHPSNHGSFVSQHPDRKVGDTFLWNGASQVVWPITVFKAHTVRHFHRNWTLAKSHNSLRKGRIQTSIAIARSLTMRRCERRDCMFCYSRWRWTRYT